MDKFPVELVECIAQYLTAEDFKQLRLTCRTLAVFTRPLLALDTFKDLPRRHDLRRLYELSRIPECARRIRCISLNLAPVDKAGFLEPYGDFHPLELEALGETWAEQQGQVELATPLALSDLVGAITRLPGLKDICFTWMRILEEGKTPQIDNRRYFSMEEKGSFSNVQNTVLSALSELDVRLDSLNLDPLLLHDLQPVTVEGWIGSRSFSSLKHLTLSLRHTQEASALKKLDLILASMPSLRGLHLDFQQEETEIELPLTAEFPYLQSLSITCAALDLSSFAHFLTKHASTITELHLSDLIALWPVRDPDASETVPVWQDIFHLIGERFQRLAVASVRGLFVLYDDPEAVVRTVQFMEAKKEVEVYLMSKGPCPAEPWESYLKVPMD